MIDVSSQDAAVRLTGNTLRATLKVKFLKNDLVTGFSLANVS